MVAIDDRFEDDVTFNNFANGIALIEDLAFKPGARPGGVEVAGGTLAALTLALPALCEASCWTRDQHHMSRRAGCWALPTGTSSAFMYCQ